MIPYDELVASLAQWRTQRGLATAATPRAAARPAAPVMPAAPVLPSTRQSGAVAAMAAPLAAAVLVEPDVAEINSFAPEFDAGDFVEHEGTELRDTTSVADGDIEVDDALDVLDEQDV